MIKTGKMLHVSFFSSAVEWVVNELYCAITYCTFESNPLIMVNQFAVTTKVVKTQKFALSTIIAVFIDFTVFIAGLPWLITSTMTSAPGSRGYRLWWRGCSWSWRGIVELDDKLGDGCVASFGREGQGCRPASLLHEMVHLQQRSQLVSHFLFRFWTNEGNEELRKFGPLTFTSMIIHRGNRLKANIT